MIGIIISMANWPLAFNLTPLADLSQYFAMFQLFETTSSGRKFLRGLQDLHARMVALHSARVNFVPPQEGPPEVPPDQVLSSEDSEDGDRDEGEQGAGPSVPGSQAPVGDIVRNEISVRGYFFTFAILVLSCFSVQPL